MLRSLYLLVYFCLYLLSLLPKLRKIEKLENEGKIQEMNTIIQDISYRWGRGVIERTGSEVEVTGISNLPDGPVLFVSNHQGNLDIPLLTGFIKKPKAYIAKVELAKIPIMSRWMEKMGCIFIDRDNPRQSLKAIQHGIDILKGGNSMVIFPEGTRSKGSEMGEFKKGSLKLATKSKVPIVPVTIDGSHKIWEDNGNAIKPAKVKIIISEPIYTDSLTKEEENDLTDRVYNIIKSHLS